MKESRLSGRRQQIGKRVFDLLVAGGMVLLALPVFLVLAVLVRLLLGTPVLFRHERPGLNEQLFTMYKFRTMTNDRNAAGELLPDEERMTSFGRFLRMTSLDELPELFNVLGGDMSLVGPRPLIPEYLTYYTEQERLRHQVRPGITGWAQVNGRNFVDWDKKLELDVWYVQNWSLALDLKILLRTAVQVVRREGVTVNAQMVEGRLDHKRSNQVLMNTEQLVE